MPEHQGKMDVNELRDYLYAFFNDGNRDHCVFPGMVYVTQPTEYGSLYSKAELEELSKSVAVTIWEPYDDNHTVVRLVTSWSTIDEDISKLDEALGKLA